MSLTKQDYEEIRKELESSVRPVYLFHDDADGLCSFLLFYRQVKDGKAIIVKSTPIIDSKFVSSTKNYHPDKIFILDIAEVDDDFLKEVSVPIIWIDHHEIKESKGMKYFNPRKGNNSNIPVSYVCYNTTNENLWIAMCGIIGDWQLPDKKILKLFDKEYPGYIDIKVKNPPELLFNSKLGKLIRIMNMSLKGDTKKVLNCIKIWTRIKSPDEVLEQTTPQGAFIFKHASKFIIEYEELLKRALKSVTKDKIVCFIYGAKDTSYTGELSNELIYKFPEKLVIVGRKKNGEYRCSLRSSDFAIQPILMKAIEQIGGRGGGHENACGATIKEENFEKFVEILRNLMP